MRSLRRLPLVLAALALFVLAACGQTPEKTEEARGVLTGFPVVLALSVLFIVLAVGAVAAAVLLDRMVRSRAALAEGPPQLEEEEEEPDEVVAGITIGRAAVPRWLYGAYVLIPVFALAYVVGNVAVAPPAAPEATEAPAEGPCSDDCVIEAIPTIKFDKAELVVEAEADITVAFTNSDGTVPHTFTVWEDEAAATGGGDAIADSGSIPGGGDADVRWKAPAAGETQYFNCTIHPNMNGNVVAEEGEGGGGGGGGGEEGADTGTAESAA